MKRKYINRLRKLYAMLAGIPNDKFVLTEWRIQDSEDDDGPAYATDEQLVHTCGTSGCAVGWACAYPPFKKAGLRYDRHYPVFDYCSGWAAVDAFFGLTSTESSDLFNGHATGEQGRKLVRNRILGLLQVKGAITQARHNELYEL